MDISFNTEEGLFNYRVCAIILRGDKILAMRDSDSTCFYLPGGRVHMSETAEEALRREIAEELRTSIDISRPLWFNQGFFVLDSTGQKVHELCLYYLAEIPSLYGDAFDLSEENVTHHFEWLDIHTLKDRYFYPLFLKKAILNLPDSLTMNIETE